MKLPSHLAKSRHGIYYFRLTTRVGGTIKEKRISLGTKNPQEARFKSSCLSAIMLTGQQQRHKVMGEKIDLVAELVAAQPAESDILLDLLQRVDREQLAALAGLPLQEVNSLLTVPETEVRSDTGLRKLDIEMPGGVVLRNVNSDEDMNRAVQILQTLNLSTQAMAQLLAGPTSVQVSNPSEKPSQPQSKASEGGTTIQEMVPRFATRKRNKLASKSLYEYGNYHNKFVRWLELRKKKKHIPVHSITRADVADFIDDLLNDGLSERTVSQKYLPAINGLFELAQTMGIISEGQLVSRGHKIFTKADFKKASAANGRKSFNEDELKKIFHPQFLAEAERPADFWVPLLALLTGARLNELCQLDIKDIQVHDEIWAIHFIDDEPDKSLKTPAARRLVPIHPILIELGFLNYVKDAENFLGGKKLFPYLSYSELDGYAATPSERWGKYLDKIGIKDDKKVFHSFRSTCNDRLKQSGVSEETRCQYVGHEHDTVNSTTYSNPHDLQYLLENVASKLDYPALDFKPLKYQAGQFNKMLAHLCTLKTRASAHKQAKEQRKAGTKINVK